MWFRRAVAFAARTPVLVVAAAVAALLVVGVFPAVPVGGDLLDASFGYTHEQAMAAYGEAGRRAYVWASLTLDVLLPIAYVVFLAGLLYRLSPREGLSVLAVVPVAAGLFDLGENAQIVAMLLAYPEVSPLRVGWASAFTQAKACAFLASAALIGVLVVLTLVRRWHNRSRAR